MGKFANIIITITNLCLLLALLGAFLMRGAKFIAPWDGPAVVTVVLAAATLVLGAVAIGVALLAVWGYTTLREHAANVAKEAAAEIARTVAIKTAGETADDAATRVATAWLERLESGFEGRAGGESVADAYKGTGGE